MSAAPYASTKPALGALHVRVQAGDGAVLDLTAARRLVLADAWARYERARGTEPALLLAGRSELLSDCSTLLAALDVSVSEDPGPGEPPRSPRALFAALHRLGLAHACPTADGPGWRLRSSSFDAVLHERLAGATGWQAAAVSDQLHLDARVDGIEASARTLDGRSLTVFARAGEAVEEAQFIAISPNHPEIAGWAPSAAQAPSVREALDTGEMMVVPGCDRLLALLVSGEVDRRYGASAALGFPAGDAVDAAVGASLAGKRALRTSTGAQAGAWTPAVRFAQGDWVVTSAGQEGEPVPVLLCEKCGEVLAPVERPEWDGAPSCPSCGGAARAPHAALSHDFALACRELAPREEGNRSERDRSERDATGAPGRTVYVFGRDGSWRLRRQRMLSAMLDAAGDGSSGEEPYETAVLCGAILPPEPDDRAGAPADTPEALLDRHGSDAVRLALLHLAAPERDVRWDRGTITFAQRYLEELRDYALPHLAWRAAEEVPASLSGNEVPRRRLRRWTDTAVARASENLETFQPHRLTRNAIMLISRIKHFEASVLDDDGGMADADRVAIRTALVSALALLAPVAPRTARELWAQSGEQGDLEAGWPARAVS